MDYYIIHKNPQHKDIRYGAEWAVDGPFERKYLAEEHARRAEYAEQGIEFRPVNEKELMDILGIEMDDFAEEEE